MQKSEPQAWRHTLIFKLAPEIVTDFVNIKSINSL